MEKEYLLSCADDVLRNKREIIWAELTRRNEIRKKRKEDKYILKQSLNTRFRMFINKKYAEKIAFNDFKSAGILTDFLIRWEKATGYMNKPSEEIKKEKINWIFFLLDMYPSEYRCHDIGFITYYLFYFRTPFGQLSFHMPLDYEGIEVMKSKSKENLNALWWGIKGYCKIVASRLDKDKKFVKKAKKYFKEEKLAEISKKTVISA